MPASVTFRHAHLGCFVPRFDRHRRRYRYQLRTGCHNLRALRRNGLLAQTQRQQVQRRLQPGQTMEQREQVGDFRAVAAVRTAPEEPEQEPH